MVWDGVERGKPEISNSLPDSAPAQRFILPESTKKDILSVPQILDHIPLFGVWSMVEPLFDTCRWRF
jgi:hypothetical protein